MPTENTPPARRASKTSSEELRTLETFLPALHAGTANEGQVQHALHFLIRRELAEDFPGEAQKHPCMPDHKHC